MSNDLSQFIIKVPKGTQLFKEGDEGHEMYFIHSGVVAIQKEIDGKKEILAVMEKGDFFGEMAVIEQMPRTASAVVEEEAHLLKVDAQHFEKLLQGNIEIAVRMIRKYAERLRDTNRRYEAVLRDRKMMDKEIEKILESAKTPPAAAPAPLETIAEFIGTDNPTVFPVQQEAVLIGRKDPVTGIIPEIDLTAIDVHRSVSRRHAKLQRTRDAFVLTEEVGVANGTVVNGERLAPGAPFTLENGAEITFGSVVFRFKVKK